jgi:hypothetical protein
MIPDYISTSINGSIFALVLSLSVAIAAGFFFYRYTLPRIPFRSRLLFTILRSLSLALLILLIFQPTLRLISENKQPPTIAVLIDATRSISLKDNLGKRDEILKKYLQSDAIQNFPSVVQLKHYTFSTKLQPVALISKDSISFSGDATNISSVISSLKDSQATQNLAAVILLTDGIYTIGRNPLYAAQEMSVPFFTVGIGDTNEQRDLLVMRTTTNNITYTETRTPVDVRIKSSGYGGENIEVELTEGSKILDRTNLVLVTGDREYPLRLYFRPEKEGTKKLTLRVSRLPGELTENNNSQSLFVKVLRSKLRVLLIAGAPSPDVSAIRQALTENRNFEVDDLIQKSADEFYYRPEVNNLFDSADCFVAIGIPSVSTSSNFIARLSSIIEAKRKPLLFVNSKNIDYSRLNLFAGFLPFMWSEPQNREILVHGNVKERAGQNSLISLGDNINAETWNQLPPIYKSKTIFKIKPEAEILLYGNTQNLQTDEPLLATRNINNQKTIGLTGYGIWRWQLLSQNDETTRSLFSLFINGSVKWLTTPDDNKRIRIISVKESYTTSEPVEFTAEVYNDQLKPVENASVTVSIHRDNNSNELLLKPVGNGRYEGFLDNLFDGDYSFTGTVKENDFALGSDSGKFTVGQMNTEFIETKMNKSLLEQMAFRTGGIYHDIVNAGKLSSEISNKMKFETKEITQTEEVELWNWKYLGGIIIFLFALEWYLRKRNGMI